MKKTKTKEEPSPAEEEGKKVWHGDYDITKIPKELRPNGEGGLHSYTVCARGLRMRVLLKESAFWTFEDKKTYAWAKRGGPAKAWEEIIARYGGEDS